MRFLASVASAASIDNVKRASPLEVKIEMIGNSGIKASITNTGASDLKAFKTGSLLDTAATEKVKVYQGKNKVGFSGVRLRIASSNLPEASFQTIKVGKTISTTFDAAELHDPNAGGTYDIVDGAKVASAFKSFHAKRQTVQSDCSGSELSATVDPINGASALTQAAADVAGSDDDKLTEYFHSTSVRDQVVDVFNKVAQETRSTSSGAAYYCTDVYDSCSSGVLAYTLPSEDYIVNCPLFFSDLPGAFSQCHAQNQQSTPLHEITHLSEIAGTADNGYGYDAATALSTQDALNNADTYALFAQAVYAGC